MAAATYEHGKISNPPNQILILEKGGGMGEGTRRIWPMTSLGVGRELSMAWALREGDGVVLEGRGYGREEG